MRQLLNEIADKSENYRPIPFWSWNDDLRNDELAIQVNEMKKSGLGGFFMHARGGLVNDYLGDEWFSAVSVCINEAQKNEMQAWCYDENGWPSGFANGAVPSRGYEFQEKCLVFSYDSSNNDVDRCLGYYIIDDDGEIKRYETFQSGAVPVFIKVNKFYIDPLNPESIQCFIKETHEKYQTKFQGALGKGIAGFFTDEPQYSKNSIPWTDALPQLFQQKYNYDIVSSLVALVYKTKGCEKVRNDFCSLVSELFTRNFVKQIFDWCNSKNIELSGHLMSEDNLFSQMSSTAGVMPSYEYFHMPGIDWLGRCISSPVVPKQVASVSEQMGIRKVITETFALCGWDVRPEELKWIAQWQYVNGVNSMCQHLQGYTIRGSRKRDYPPSLFIQQPWWDEYKKFNDYFARLGALLSMGKSCADVLLLHPIKSAYIAYDLTYNHQLKKIDDSFTDTTTILNNLHIEHHYGDETIIKKYGDADNGKIRVGNCEYSILLLPELLNISSETFEIIKILINCGGTVFRTGAQPTFLDGVESPEVELLFEKIKYIDLYSGKIESLITGNYVSIKENGYECKEVHYCSRLLADGNRIFYFVNNDKEKAHQCTICINGNKQLHIVDLEDMRTNCLPCETACGKSIIDLKFMPMQSFVLAEHTAEFNILEEAGDIEIIGLDEELHIEEISQNAITLDCCSYRIDNGEWQPAMAVILLQNELLRRQKHCDIEMRFNFVISDMDLSSKIYLVVESPEKFEITVNDRIIDYLDCGYFIDKSFRRIEINSALNSGINTISLKCKFYQNKKVYDILFGKDVHESEKNKITYDTELESIYITGEFTLKNKSSFKYSDRKAIWTSGDFELFSGKKYLLKGDFTSQGLWFFSGKVRLSQKRFIQAMENKKYYLRFNNIYAPAVKVIVNGRMVKTVLWAPYEVDISEYLINGENNLEFIVYSSNRNLLGPHHYADGESYFVGPSTFTDQKGWADNCEGDMWAQDYCFVKFGID